MSDNETIKVELPEIEGFVRYRIGETTMVGNTYVLTASGLQCRPHLLPWTINNDSSVYYRRIEPENPPLPSRENCEKWGYEFPTVCDVPTKDNCDGWVDAIYTHLYYRASTPEVTLNPKAFGGRRWLLRKKQVPLSFETWYGPLSIKARRKCDGRLVRIDAQPDCLAVEKPGAIACYEAPYSEVDEDYETLDGGRIGRGN